jgi:hypothetical protein
MDDTYRRSISELVARYRFHPEFRDLFVEGDRDVSVFDWFLSRIPTSRAAVYPINAIEVTRTIRQEMGVTEGGNKGRAIALALKLDRELPPECRSVLSTQTMRAWNALAGQGPPRRWLPPHLRGSRFAEGRIGGRRKKLDLAKRREIAESVISGRKTGAEMARLYNVSAPTVSRIVAGHRTILNKSSGDPGESCSARSGNDPGCRSATAA